ncbi:MAG: S9 family peptidase, partial [Anaerolineaceae bacterium]|nr:S9 family peptidase [Anaerolineaceae bacterium]
GGTLLRRSLGYELPKAILPGFGSVASPTLSPDGNWVLYVYTDGQNDLIGMVDAEGAAWPRKLVEGADFYMQPCWHPSGEMIAWVEWLHPNMPWDGSWVCLGRMDPGDDEMIPGLFSVEQVAGGDDIPAQQPRFSPDGRFLSYVVCDGEWDSLVLYDLQTKETRTLVEGDGFMLTRPAWVQGNHEYDWGKDSDRIYYLRLQNGFSTLWWVDIETGRSEQIDVSPYTYLTQLSVSPKDGQLAFIGSSPMVPARILRWDGARIHTVRRSDPENIAPEQLPVPKPIEWKAKDGTKVYGLYYPPTNPQYTSDELPPAIVNIHGGPTGQQEVRYRPTAAYFTSRGYAWMEVNYRGSAGYGRSYQMALNGNWGLVDTEDAVGAAYAMIDQDLADEKRLVIMGGSAGGYTVLNALIQYPGVFAAGIDQYGVSDLYGITLDTHKFEAHYNDSLVGPLPEAAEKYKAWSPVFHADQIKDPLAVFQGSEDVVVPPSQSEKIVSVLRQNHVPHIYQVYEGEGHGFRKAENKLDFLKQVEEFLMKHVLFV